MTEENLNEVVDETEVVVAKPEQDGGYIAKLQAEKASVEERRKFRQERRRKFMKSLKGEPKNDFGMYDPDVIRKRRNALNALMGIKTNKGEEAVVEEKPKKKSTKSKK